jgi:hypothetical protein
MFFYHFFPRKRRLFNSLSVKKYTETKDDFVGIVEILNIWFTALC